MEVIEFLIFLSVNIILLIISLTRKGALFSIIGMITCIFSIPFILSSGLVLDRFYVTNSTGIIEQQTVNADPTFILVTMSIMTIAHALAILRSVKTE